LHTESAVDDGTVGLFWYLLNHSRLDEDDLTTFLTECYINPTLRGENCDFGIYAKNNQKNDDKHDDKHDQKNSINNYTTGSVSLERLTPRGENVLMYALLRSAGGCFRPDYSSVDKKSIFGKKDEKNRHFDNFDFSGPTFTESMLFKLLVHLGVDSALEHKDVYGRGILDYIFFCNTQRYAPKFVAFVLNFFNQKDKKIRNERNERNEQNEQQSQNVENLENTKMDLDRGKFQQNIQDDEYYDKFDQDDIVIQ
jgi:hypothetical protein